MFIRDLDDRYDRNNLDIHRFNALDDATQYRPDLGERLIAAIVSFLANRRLARAARRYRSRGSPEVPDYLREDLGMPPLDGMFRYHDHFQDVQPAHIPYKRRR